MGARRGPDLSWVDEFIARIRPWIFVRVEDSVLIQMPNRAQKLNRPGALLLRALLDGASIGAVARRAGGDPRKLLDIALFLHDVRRMLEGSLDDQVATRATERRPFELGFSSLPILSEVALTYRCNLRCSFCYAGCNCTTNPARDAREMTAREVRRVLARIRREAQVPSVSFTGGEPTARADLPSLVRFAKGLGMRVNLITNGTLMDRRGARALARAGLDSAQVSLEGVTAGTHDRATGVEGSFERSVAAVGHLRGAGIRVHTNTTLHRGNLDEALGMPRFVRDRLGGDRFSMNLVVPSGSASLHRDVGVRYEEIGPRILELLDESRRVGVEFLWYSTVPMCLFNPIPHGLGNKGCAACDGLLSVAANGDVLPCSSYDEPLGNLLEEGFLAVWNSPRARYFRDKGFAHPRCRACEDFAACNGACPLYWREIGFGEIGLGEIGLGEIGIPAGEAPCRVQDR